MKDESKYWIIIPIAQLFSDAAKMRVFIGATQHDEGIKFITEHERTYVKRKGDKETIDAVVATFKLSNIYYERGQFH